MRSCMSWTGLRLGAIVVAGAIGLASPASVALAQASHGGDSANSAKSASSTPASKPGSVSGVVVQAPPKSKIPPDKRAAFDAEAAKRKAWQAYRGGAPVAKPTMTTGVSASARAENYPGLHTLNH